METTQLALNKELRNSKTTPAEPNNMQRRFGPIIKGCLKCKKNKQEEISLTDEWTARSASVGPAMFLNSPLGSTAGPYAGIHLLPLGGLRGFYVDFPEL